MASNIDEIPTPQPPIHIVKIGETNLPEHLDDVIALNDEFLEKITAIRRLKPGESIHHSNFKPAKSGGK